ncbi:aspartate/glutamate racemase family protein [Halanaerobium hydrogeniformans]|uniref:Asp/Glu/hydantoin racemase n=1 Tax=Halanaerobium hydrogeniformans TaxID=656519 RepID=E4RLI8_HALHG|nr:aspartate/glutamate racemase family protein [Halanaerobium hydrogeniformans]ADQ14902.1 Asp/Glu/hydantoin racemase [Halanaerobium hydrogeniformans]
MGIKYGITAGTPFDTKLGEIFFSKKGLEVVSAYISETADEQNRLQYISPKKLEIKTINTIRHLKKAGANIIIIYCNSLSAVLEVDKISALTDIPILTPLAVYKNLDLSSLDKLAILAANSQSAAKIENIIAEKNPHLEFVSAGIMPIINAIEAQKDPTEILAEAGLQELLVAFRTMGADTLLLGCTHLPYLKEEIKGFYENIIDPADKIKVMAEKLLAHK